MSKDVAERLERWAYPEEPPSGVVELMTEARKSVEPVR